MARGQSQRPGPGRWTLPNSSHPRVVEVPDPVDPMLSWLLERAGLDPAIYRARALERRLAAFQRQLGARSRAEARQLLEREPHLVKSVLNSVLIGVSEFFRDSEVFAQIEKVVLPELMETRDFLRVYAPGVSAGQELYSVAMLLAERGWLEKAAMLGVDCRPDAIASARAGLFAALDGVPAEWRPKYFCEMWAGWQVVPTLQQPMRWEVADLFSRNTVEKWDLILFRNVAIYFTPAAAAHAWDLLCDQLAPGGYLVTGKAEKPPAHLPLLRLAPSLYQKQSS
jgi:chemotaxis protein methyltransferase CheR